MTNVEFSEQLVKLLAEAGHLERSDVLEILEEQCEYIRMALHDEAIEVLRRAFQRMPKQTLK